MDSDERHELQENDLAEFFKNFGEFWNKYGTWIVGVIAAVAIVFAAYNLITRRAETARQNAWLDLYGSVTYESYQLVADEHSGNPAVVAAANLRGADLLLAQANEPARSEDDLETSGVLNRDEALDTAEQMYQAAYDAAPDPVYRLNALEGLGVVAESRYDLDAARQRYDAIVEAAGDTYPTWSARAKQRLDWLSELESGPVEFAPDPAVPSAAAPATQPAATQPSQ